MSRTWGSRSITSSCTSPRLRSTCTAWRILRQAFFIPKQTRSLERPEDVRGLRDVWLSGALLNRLRGLALGAAQSGPDRGDVASVGQHLGERGSGVVAEEGLHE